MLKIKYKPNLLYSLELFIKFKILKSIEFLLYKNSQRLKIIIPIINFFFKVFASKRYYKSNNEIDEFSNFFKYKFREIKTPNQKVLFFSFNGANSYHTFRNLLLSYFFQMKGYDVEWYVCKEGLSICQKDRIFREREKYRYFCDECFYGYDTLKNLSGLKIHFIEKKIQTDKKFEKLISEINSLEECINFNYNEIPFGKICKISVLYFLTQPKFFNNDFEIFIYKKYILAALELFNYLEQINLNDVKFIFTNNGSFFSDQLINFLSNKREIDFITQEIYDHPNSWIYAKNKIAVYAEKFEDFKEFSANFKLDPETLNKIKIDLDLRKRFSNDKNFMDYFEGKINVGLFPNFVWDSTVLDRNLYFESLFDWITETIEFFKNELKNINLIIRDHPAPSIYKSQKSIVEIKYLIKPYLKHSNIFYYPPNSKITSYDVMKVIKLGLVYNSTIGLEILNQNIPVIVSGKVHYRDVLESIKNVSRKSDYFNLIKNILLENRKIPIKQDEILSYYYFWQNFTIKKFYGFRENYFAKRIEIAESDFNNLLELNIELLEKFYKDII